MVAVERIDTTPELFIQRRNGERVTLGTIPVIEAVKEPVPFEEVEPLFGPAEMAVWAIPRTERAVQRRLHKRPGEVRLPKHKRPSKDKTLIPTKLVTFRDEETYEEKKKVVPLSLAERSTPYAKGAGMRITDEEREKAIDVLRRDNIRTRPRWY